VMMRSGVYDETRCIVNDGGSQHHGMRIELRC